MAAVAPPGEAARAAVNEVTGGLGAGAVFDTVGGPQLLEDALKLLQLAPGVLTDVLRQFVQINV